MFVRQHFGDDEAVTSYTNVLVVRTGGLRPDGAPAGIHWHVSPQNQIRYISTDGNREKIDWIEWTNAEGEKRVYATEDIDPEDPPPQGELRTMDCVDCHNQPSHIFEEPELALDKALSYGLVSRDLPFIRKFGLEALRRGWTRATASAGIRSYIEDAYASNGALPADAQAKLSPSIDSIVSIWMRNIYPQMEITWGTYPSFANHRGCFRCHDGNHTDVDGEEISMDCENCHTLLAERETDPEVLRKLGIDIKDR
jgi:hypothetical protein